MAKEFDIDGAFAHNFVPHGTGTYVLYISDVIESPTQFIPFVESIRGISSDDEIYIYLNTGGGDLDATDMLLQALEMTQAKVTIFASGGVHSAGSLILLRADAFVLSEDFNCLIHNGAVGAYGKTSDWHAQSVFAKKRMDALMWRHYKHFLSDQEIEDVIAGKDVWLDGDQFLERFNNMQEKLAEEAGTDDD